MSDTTNPALLDKLTIEYRKGDLFADAPEGTLLVHACNGKGVWGSGVAKQFREIYPAAFREYKAHCSSRSPDDLVGTALLIAPLSVAARRARSIEGQGAQNAQVYIGCLFTREGYGKPTGKELRDGYENGILDATGAAMLHLMKGLASSIESGELSSTSITEVRMPLINSGKFAVPWAKTEAVLMDLNSMSELPSLSSILVYEH